MFQSGPFPSGLPTQFFSSTCLHSKFDHPNATYWRLKITKHSTYNYLHLPVTSPLRLNFLIYKWWIHPKPRHFVIFYSTLVFMVKGCWLQPITHSGESSLAGYLWQLIQHIHSYPYVEAGPSTCNLSMCCTVVTRNTENKKCTILLMKKQTHLILRYGTLSI